MTKVRLVETIAIMQNSIPIRGELERAMSYLMAADVEAGRYTQLELIARRNYTYGLCQELPTTETVTQFGLSDLAGPMLFLVVTVVISLVVTRIGKRLEKRSEALKAELDIDGDGEVSQAEMRSAMLERLSKLELLSKSSQPAVSNIFRILRHHKIKKKVAQQIDTAAHGRQVRLAKRPEEVAAINAQRHARGWLSRIHTSRLEDQLAQALAHELIIGV